MADAEGASRRKGPPTVTGLSPTEGTPGTQITIRGEFLGNDQDDLLMLFICGTDCLHTVRWKSPSKIIARVGQANRGLGEVQIATKSGGRGVSHVKFRIFIAQVGPLEESAVWVDESRTVPGREALRVVTQINDERDALGLFPSKKMDISLLQREFPDGSGNLRMESFEPQWYLLENHSETPIENLREAIKNMQLAKADEAKKNEQMHKANLYSLINCVDTLASLHDEIERGDDNGDFKVIKLIANEITEAKNKAENVFKEVLSRKDQADATRNALSVITRFKFIFFLSKSIDDNMAKGEYLTILNDYTRAKALYKNTPIPLFQEVMEKLDAKMVDFKEEVKHKLMDTPASYEEQSKLIKYLKILEPDSDPTWECIMSYHQWLEDVLWQLQEEHHENALKTATSRRGFSVMETDERQLFVSSMVSVLSNKLQSFWKLSNTYTPGDGRWTQRHDDINNMLTNTINVASWLILNALIPELVPDEQKKRYAEQFVQWPQVSSGLSSVVIINCLKMVRNFISSLLDFQFSNTHIQPLIEVCTMLRVKVIANAVEKSVSNIHALYKKENWQQDSFDSGISKTTLPDLYHHEVCECISSIREALSSTGYPGEICLFSRETIRLRLIEFFVKVVCSISRCFNKMLNLTQETRRPQDLDLSGREEEVTQVTPRKLLISICNLEYIVESSLRNISRRMAECGIKYSDVIYEQSRLKISEYRQKLIEGVYIKMKLEMFRDLVESCNYEYIPEEDVSDYAKEMMMCFVLQQAELELHSPQLTNDCLQMTVQFVLESLVDHISATRPDSVLASSQCVIDLSALEEALDSYLSLQTRTHLNAFRAEMVAHVDQGKLARCLNNMRNAMRLAIESLDRTGDEELNTSSI